MNYPVKIVGALLDVHRLTMYMADGETIEMLQGDPRLKDLIAKLAPALETGERVYWLTAKDMEDINQYADTEKKLNGAVRFFKMLKSKVKEIVDKHFAPIPDMQLGNTSGEAEAEPVTEVPAEPVVEDGLKDVHDQLDEEAMRPLTKGETAVAEIMANAVPSSAKDFAVVNQEKGAEEVIVAVTEDNTVIPAIEQISKQISGVASGLTTAAGFKRFMERASSVTRGHTVEDLLKFMEKGELPIADDGTVLVYKRLQSTSEEGVFVDVHSKKVKQRIGSFVHMAESMVDPNRSQDCSHGLHVARLDYLPAFSGNVIVLCKLAPEDVIAVPQYDARKLRAKGYHIICRLDESDVALVSRGKPMQNTEMLSRAVVGNHVGIQEYVEITQSHGGGLKITAAEEAERAEAPLRPVVSLELLEEGVSTPVDAKAVALDVAQGKDQTVEVTTDNGEIVCRVTGDGKKDEQIIQAPPGGMIVCQVDESCGQATPPPVPKLNERDQLIVNWHNAETPADKLVAARAILAYKKAKKKSWTALGIPTAVWTKALECTVAGDIAAENAVTKADCKPEIEALAKTLPKTKPRNDDAVLKKPAKGKNTAVKGPRPSASKPTPSAKPASAPKVKKMTQQEEMAKLVELYNANPDKLNARAIFTFKQKSKKSWEKLGVTDVKFQKKITERAKL